MRTFFAKCLLLIVIVSGILWIGGLAYQQSNAYRNLEYDEESYQFHEVPDEIEIAAFGSSHGRDSYQYFPENKTAFNFSMSSQTPRYDWMMLRQYGDHLAPKATVIVTISYFSLYFAETSDSFNAKQERYYRILDPSQIINVDISHWLLQRLSPLLTASPPTIISALLNPPVLHLDASQLAGMQKMEPESIEAEQARIREHHVAVMAPYFPEVNPDMWSAYCKILDLCAENGWHAVLVTPPYLEKYSECFPDEFFPSFYEDVNLLAQEYGVPHLDYSHDAEFLNRYDLFKNIDHLNFDGANTFDRRLWMDIGLTFSPEAPLSAIPASPAAASFHSNS